MENPADNPTENGTKARVYLGLGLANNGESHGKEHGTSSGNCGYLGLVASSGGWNEEENRSYYIIGDYIVGQP